MLVESRTVADAWLKVAGALAARGATTLAPLAVVVEGIPKVGDLCPGPFLAAVDALLVAHQCKTVHTVANTIFPENLWLRSVDFPDLVRRYRDLKPRLRKANPRGTYFERLISFTDDDEGNQLQHVLKCWDDGVRRRSALQAVIFDPRRDHKATRQLGFPCLQQVSFAPNEDGGLTVNAYYTTQWVFDRALGNYLGLCALGRFMGQQVGLPLTRMTCMAAQAQLGGGIVKTELKEHLQRLRDLA